MNNHKLQQLLISGQMPMGDPLHVGSGMTFHAVDGTAWLMKDGRVIDNRRYQCDHDFIDNMNAAMEDMLSGARGCVMGAYFPKELKQISGIWDD